LGDGYPGEGREFLNSYALVPARGGSVRIPGKNMRDFLGKPALRRVLETLAESQLFREIIVSTDSPATIEAVASRGFRAPFLRPAELSTNQASTAQVASHAITWLIEKGASENDSFLLAYPTAVLMNTEHLIQSEKLFRSSAADLVFSACPFPSNIERAWKKSSDNFVVPANDAAQPMRSQDFEPHYYDAGQFYWSNESAWRNIVRGQRPVYRAIYELDPMEAVDINTEEDWRRAERYFQLFSSHQI